MATKTDTAYMRKFYPYGYWETADGSRELFNRGYESLETGNKASKLQGPVTQHWLFGDESAPWLSDTDHDAYVERLFENEIDVEALLC